MKELWLKLSARVDALSLRERVFAFAGVAAVLVYLTNMLVLAPLAAKQAALGAKVTQQQSNIASLAQDLEARVQAAQVDPDEPLRKRLAELDTEIAERGEALRTVQKGLVAPEKIGPLLEAMLRSNGKLRLVSLRTLPVTGLSEAAVDPVPPAPTKEGDRKPAELNSAALTAAAVKEAGGAAAPAPDLSKLPPGMVPVNGAALVAAAAAKPETPATAPSKPPELMYRHGVELTLQGSYLDMLNYMGALEAMPTQVFWGKAKLDARDFDQARLTLTVYTLNLDQKWMKL
ncbi:MAG TPA: hypothetical protein VFF16_13610 [Telluria sp.]|nr:hypothetical protein [Telluria sp.]